MARRSKVAGRGGATWLVVNAASGSNQEDSLEQLKAQLAGIGHAPARIMDLQHDAPPSCPELERGGVGLLAIFAGDGSTNAVVRGLDGWGGQLLVLPGGTSNLLSCALHGADAPVEAIIARLGAGELHAVTPPCIRCSQGEALIEILAGPGATWSDVREELRNGDLAQVAGTALEAARLSATGPMVRVVDPELGREEGYSGVRLTPQSGQIQIAGYGATGLGEFVRQGVAILRRDFREGPHDDLGAHPWASCRSVDGSPIELMIDGERATGLAEEKFSLAPLHVNLLASRHD